MLGPDSLTWRYFGDRRMLLFVHRSGVLQNMHPAVASVLLERSDFFDDPFDRLARSIPHILGVVYDDPAERTGERVRDFHRGLSADDHRGRRRWHALDPSVYYWTHATFVEIVVAMNERFGTPLTEAEKDQLIAESVAWWRAYGMTERPVARTWAEFERYWQRMLDTELERNPVTDFAYEATDDMPAPPRVPALVWRVGQRPFVRFNRWLSTGLLPPRAREILGLEWTSRDERLLRLLAAVIRAVWPLVPERLRYNPRAYAGIRRARAEAAAARRAEAAEPAAA